MMKKIKKEITIENSFFNFSFSRANAALISLFDKRTNKSLFKGKGEDEGFENYIQPWWEMRGLSFNLRDHETGKYFFSSLNPAEVEKTKDPGAYRIKYCQEHNGDNMGWYDKLVMKLGHSDLYKINYHEPLPWKMEITFILPDSPFFFIHKVIENTGNRKRAFAYDSNLFGSLRSFFEDSYSFTHAYSDQAGLNFGRITEIDSPKVMKYYKGVPMVFPASYLSSSYGLAVTADTNPILKNQDCGYYRFKSSDNVLNETKSCFLNNERHFHTVPGKMPRFIKKIFNQNEVLFESFVNKPFAWSVFHRKFINFEHGSLAPIYLEPGEQCSVLYTFLPPLEEKLFFPFNKNPSQFQKRASFFCTVDSQKIIRKVEGGVCQLKMIDHPIEIEPKANKVNIELEQPFYPFLWLKVKGEVKDIRITGEYKKYQEANETVFYCTNVTRKEIEIML